MTSDKKSVCFIINYNSFDEVKSLIESVKIISFFSFIVIADNSSDEFLCNYCNDKGVIYIDNGKNIGFGAAYNYALKWFINKYGKSDLYFFINNDMIVSKETLGRISSFDFNKNNAGLISCLTYKPNMILDISSFERLNFLESLFDNLYFHRRKRIDKAINKTDSIPKDIVVSVDCVRESFMCLDDNSLSSLGYEMFDDHIFLYNEAYILSSKLDRINLKRYIDTGCYAIHNHKQRKVKIKDVLTVNIATLKYYVRYRKYCIRAIVLVVFQLIGLFEFIIIKRLVGLKKFFNKQL